MGDRGAKGKGKFGPKPKLTVKQKAQKQVWVTTPKITKTPDLEAFNRSATNRSVEDSLKNSNPNYDKPGTAGKYTRNCQRCVFAYELQRRGYDVEARARALDKSGNGKNDPIWNHYYTDIATNNQRNLYFSRKALEDQMKSFGDGARAMIDLQWKNNGGGHAFIVENVGGNIVYRDPQDGNKNCGFYMGYRKINSAMGLRRLDNAVFNKKAIALAVKNKGDNSIE